MTIALAVIHFLLLTGFSYRVQRIITSDEWPPSDWFRHFVSRRTGSNSGWSTFFSCPWCFGFWVTVAAFTFDHFVTIPTFILAIATASTLVGLVGNAD